MKEVMELVGGLSMMWKSNDNVKVLEYNKNLITIKIFDLVCHQALVGFYSPLYASKKAKAWMNLTTFLEFVQCPWVYIGAFNYTLSQDDILGGRMGFTSTTNHLKDLMFEFRAIDLWFSKNKFTWAKYKFKSAAVKRRLDRGITSIAWRLPFPKAYISHLRVISSNHSPSPTNPSTSKQHGPGTQDATLSLTMRKMKMLEAHNIPSYAKCKRVLEKEWLICSEPFISNGSIEATLQAKLKEWLIRSEGLWRQSLGSFG